MLKQASIRQIKKGEISKQNGYLSVTMCFYPRGMKSELMDEYRSDLAPDRELFADFKKFQSEFGHEEAFEKSQYLQRFTLARRALEHLKVLAQQSREQDVYLICQCELGEMCHREILLLIAEKEFGASIDPVHHSYETFLKRLPEVVKSMVR